ncbi:ephrin-B3 isoform X1 [Pelobates cultripes]|uniref:Ephrin-B3 isoform X1 n=1 Tax=Pelobates cultripes TaxID=61616 RepID=A0AAD1RJ42_PELCU|nr:ephrin-B3 isoform X1 [Pelobates cultripes]
MFLRECPAALYLRMVFTVWDFCIISALSLDPIYWNSSNKRFQDSEGYVLYPQIGDRLDLLCPRSEPRGPFSSSSYEYYKLYLVGTEDEVLTCSILRTPNLLLTCDRPGQDLRFTIKFQEYSPNLWGHEFKSQRDYYIIVCPSCPAPSVTYLPYRFSISNNLPPPVLPPVLLIYPIASLNLTICPSCPAPSVTYLPYRFSKSNNLPPPVLPPVLLIYPITSLNLTICSSCPAPSVTYLPHRFYLIIHLSCPAPSVTFIPITSLNLTICSSCPASVLLIYFPSLLTQQSAPSVLSRVNGFTPIASKSNNLPLLSQAPQCYLFTPIASAPNNLPPPVLPPVLLIYPITSLNLTICSSCPAPSVSSLPSPPPLIFLPPSESFPSVSPSPPSGDTLASSVTKRK